MAALFIIGLLALVVVGLNIAWRLVLLAAQLVAFLVISIRIAVAWLTGERA